MKIFASVFMAILACSFMVAIFPDAANVAAEFVLSSAVFFGGLLAVCLAVDTIMPAKSQREVVEWAKQMYGN